MTSSHASHPGHDPEHAHGHSHGSDHSHPESDSHALNDARHAGDDGHSGHDHHESAHAHGHGHAHAHAHAHGHTDGRDHGSHATTTPATARQHQSHEEHPHDQGDQAQADMLDLDAEVLAEHLAAITVSLPVHASPGQIVDLGSGTGAGTFALLERFPEAHVTAVDASAEHLARLREKARDRAVDGHVHTVEADLDAPDWPELGRPGLVWASASLHHVADPDRALRTVRDLLAPGGLLAVVELSGFPRFLPAAAPADRPGLEERCHAAADRKHAEHVPHRGADWAAKLAAAGFAVEDERTVRVDIAGSRDNAVGAYALAVLRRIRDAVADDLVPEDLAALDRLLDTDSPDSVLRRDDLAVRTERTVWAARRPA